MAKTKSIEVVLAIKATAELINSLDALRAAWKLDLASVPTGLSCSESKDGKLILVAAESVFVTLPGAVELLTTEPVFEPGANSKSLPLKDTADGWRFSVKYVLPIVRKRNAKKIARRLLPRLAVGVPTYPLDADQKPAAVVGTLPYGEPCHFAGHSSIIPSS